jgi:hypothetical protein
VASAGGEKGEAISLNIMPMLDIFSILVTFLLMSFSTDPLNHDLHQGVELPMSDTISGLDEVPDITASPTELLLNEKKIVDIVNGDVPEGARDQGAIRPLFDELEKLRESNLRVNKAVNKKDKTGSLTLEMDRRHNFKLMKRIMLSGQQAEFITFKLAVRKELE